MTAGKVRIGISNMDPQQYLTFMSGDNDGSPEYTALTIDEVVRFPGTPLAFSIEDGVLSRERPSLQRYQDAGKSFQDLLADSLAAQASDEVLLYVHGFNNTFEHGAFNLFEIWNASGRLSVPILFSWPTGGRSVFGYLGDTQDADFAIYHLKEVLRLISATPEVNSITLVAHSRGVSLATDALRELMIEARGSGLSMRDTYRIENLILAAPDMDLGVMEQRLVAEAFGLGFGQINVYVNPGDDALGLSGWLYGAPRFGAMTPDAMSEESKAVFRGVRSVSFIAVEDADQFDAHNYFRRHPGVLADIAVTISTSAHPGDPERPLEKGDLNFWSVNKHYVPQPKPQSNGP
ncbi:MAG TPA: alpha/beta hydrolase [Hyphomonas sp.]|nr:alpha/beta hydrolase [Hyphomonas sp.]